MKNKLAAFAIPDAVQRPVAQVSKENNSYLTRIPWNAVSPLPVLYHKVEVTINLKVFLQEQKLNLKRETWVYFKVSAIQASSVTPT